ncbi:WecB/TagA/CpsF family glycosyltransferase [Paenibacillus rhizovicinus]|uniref:N-acetylglucosaminyldiphosphoundecaprenol N-acetyl-beta-D-mannosaminyltransferase n=1 Tax=Paenibacillus rhizovicinus TaxID=2704463 RepID=A0A6C0NW11_9BACL|nr:WecB/TagA/CpsF family glycosyltransferase [Paenibacillus rhizovicinus]QHW29913.1 WecB/TagA/CpsF family glycosyltransferase [Paenibacillus rhizovicinus]
MTDHSKIMGIPVPKLTMAETVARVQAVIQAKKQKLYHIVTLNPEIAMSCQQDQELRGIIDEADLLTADGIGIVMVSRMRRNPLPERVTGCDLLFELLEAGNRRQWSFYLLGGSEETNKRAAEVMQAQYPRAVVAGRQHGFFDPSEDERIAADITAKRPDVLVVALGAPKAERWIHAYKDRLDASIAVGVGGSLDIVAGTVKRAPRIWQRLHAEWLFRLINQPSRWRRQLILPRFALKALFYKERGELS